MQPHSINDLGACHTKARKTQPPVPREPQRDDYSGLLRPPQGLPSLSASPPVSSCGAHCGPGLNRPSGQRGAGVCSLQDGTTSLPPTPVKAVTSRVRLEKPLSPEGHILSRAEETSKHQISVGGAAGGWGRRWGEPGGHGDQAPEYDSCRTIFSRKTGARSGEC